MLELMLILEAEYSHLALFPSKGKGIDDDDDSHLK